MRATGDQKRRDARLRRPGWPCRGLADDLFGLLEALGVYERERRLWLPHVTVTRFRRPLGLDPVLPESSPSVRPTRLFTCLRLHPSGAQYEVLESFGLRLKSGSRASTGHRPRADRATVRQGLGHEDDGRRGRERRLGFDGLAVARPRSRDRWSAARAGRRDLRPGVVGEDDARLPRDRRGAAPRRHLRVHRRRACDGRPARSGSA